MVKLNIISENGGPIQYGRQREFPPQNHPTYNPKEFNLETAQFDKYAPPSKLSFIETGTYRGDTFVRLMKHHPFKYGRTVELNDDIISEGNMISIRSMVAESKGERDLGICRGDSPDLIPIFLAEIKTKFPDPKDQEVTFWLDAHASGELGGGRSGGCPLVDELREIAKDTIKTHTIFVNDRRLFGSAEWSYVTEKQVMDELLKINPNYKITLLEGQVLPEDIIVASVYDNG